MSKVTIVVEFGDDVADALRGSVVVELDPHRNLDENGEPKSQFFTGDEVHFLVHYDSAELRIEAVKSTDGMVVGFGTESQARQQDLLFTSDESVSLSYLPAGGVSGAWQGNVGSGLTVDGGAVTVKSGWPCLMKASYPVSFARYRLIPPPLSLAEDEQYTIVCVVYMEAA